MATTSSHHVNAALAGVRRRGLDAAPLLTAAGINPQIAAIATSRVHEQQMSRLIQQVWITLEDEFMGCTEHPCRLGSFAMMALCVQQFSTLGQMLRTAFRFYALLTDDIITTLGHDGDTAWIEARFARPELDPGLFFHEFWLVIWHRFASWFIGRGVALELAEFAYLAPAHVEELQALFPCPHRYSAPAMRLVFPAEVLAAPLVRTPDEVRGFLRHSPLNLMAPPGSSRLVSARIRAILERRLRARQKFPGMDELCRRLHVSAPTLHRRLLSEGTSYQKLKDDIRQDLAIHGLVHERLPVQEVATRLGYTEARSFTRAFRGWTGLSPRAYCRFVQPAD